LVELTFDGGPISSTRLAFSTIACDREFPREDDGPQLIHDPRSHLHDCGPPSRIDLRPSPRALVVDCTQIGYTMITVSKEDYLKAVSEAEAEGQIVIAATLAHWLSVTPPAVTAALKRLTKDGMVTVNGDGRIQLTSEGREVAERTILRHHLIERILSEMFGMAWYEVHDEAERLEHAVSPAFEKQLVAKLGNRGVCPHGNALALRIAEEHKRGVYVS